VGSRRATAAQVSEELFAWNWIGFAIVLTGGFMLFSGIATTFISNIAFQWKLGMFVPLALTWHVVVQRKARVWGQTSDTPGIARFAALTEILLWICVVTAAVEIPNH
jgi:membrane protein implicated in regulation of membrane protease activity